LCRVRVVIVSSPGAGAEPHWSHVLARSLAERLRADAVEVEWFAAGSTGEDDGAAPRPPSAACRRFPFASAPLDRVRRGHEHLALEQALTRTLRERLVDAVVHLGPGARGSANVLWLAERLGSEPIAVARASEVLCQRGTLVDERGRECRSFDDAERCRICCTASRWRRPRADAFRSRLDLVVAGLQAATAVFVAGREDADLLADAGIPRRALHCCADAEVPAAIAAHVARTAASAGRRS
jgi:hypothetical protein